MSSQRNTRIPAISEKELQRGVAELLSELADPVTCCAKVVWNDPYQLKYVPPFGDEEVIRVNLIAPTEAGAREEAEAILERLFPGVEWCIG